MRRLYGRRRAVFLKLLDDHLGGWLDPIDGRTGIQLAALFKTPTDDNLVVDRAARPASISRRCRSISPANPAFPGC